MSPWWEGVECLPCLDCALHIVVEDLGADGGVVARLDDHQKEFSGNSGVEPRDDAGVDLHPLGIDEHGASIDYVVDAIQRPNLQNTM